MIQRAHLGEPASLWAPVSSARVDLRKRSILLVPIRGITRLESSCIQNAAVVDSCFIALVG